MGYHGMHDSMLAVVLTPMVKPWRLVSHHNNNNTSEKTVLIKSFKTLVSIKTTNMISVVLTNSQSVLYGTQICGLSEAEDKEREDKKV